MQLSRRFQEGCLEGVLRWVLVGGRVAQVGFLVALYRENLAAILVTDPAKQRPVFVPPLPPDFSQESVLKVPKKGQFHVEIRVPKEH